MRRRRRAPLYLVDASVYVFRAWHSMPNEFTDADGWPTNAVHGFARFLLELLERARPHAHRGGVRRGARQLLPQPRCTRPTRPTAIRRRTNSSGSSPHCKRAVHRDGHDRAGAHRIRGGRPDRQRAARGARARFPRRDRVGRQGPLAAARRPRRAMGFRARPALGRGRRAGAPRRARRPDRRLPRPRRRRRRQHPRRARASARRRPPRCSRISARSTRCCGAWRKCPTCRRSAVPRAARSSCARTGSRRCCRRALATIALDAPLRRRRRAVPRAASRRARSWLALCDRLRFGPLTRRRLHAACGLDFMPAASATP